MKRRLGSIGAALVLTFGVVAIAHGNHDSNGLPRVTIGRSAGSLTANQVIPWKFGGTYDAWVKTAFETSLENHFSNITYNNSKSPTWVGPDAAAAAVMYYSSAGDSPCNLSPNPGWIQCARDWTTLQADIYIRNFDAAPLGGLGWYEENGNCTGYTACHYAKRALIHEIGHATFSLDHDEQGRTLTVMGSYNPCHGTSSECDDETNWNWPYLLECDEAAGQLLWDLEDTSRDYANCFQNIPGHATTGNLKSTLTVAGTSFTHCTVSAQAVSGRLQIFDDATNYKVLAKNPLTLRTVEIDRKKSTSSTWTGTAHSATANSNTGNNWTASIAYPGSTGVWNYLAHFDGDVGVAKSSTVAFNISWTTSGCPSLAEP